MSKYKITKDVPIPTTAHSGRQATKYPFPDMEIGDSFFANIPSQKLSSAAINYGKRYGMRFTVRKEGDGSRVWRIENEEEKS